MNWKDIGHEIGRRAQEKAKKDLLPSVLRHAASFLTETAMLLERPEAELEDGENEVDVENSRKWTGYARPAPKLSGDIVIHAHGGSEDAGAASAARVAEHVARVRQEHLHRVRQQGQRS